MKFTCFLTLIISSRAEVFKTCTDTWTDAADAACGSDEQCFDWQNADQTETSGLKCGLSTDCALGQFVYEGTTYFAKCDGLSLADCGSNRNLCDGLAGFKCADWDHTDGSHTIVGCASPAECLAEAPVNSNIVQCSGLVGANCTTNADCDAHANKCGNDFNNKTLNFTIGTNKCIKAEYCGKLKEGSSMVIHACYNESINMCGDDKPCMSPNGTSLDAACGDFAPKAGDVHVKTCIDRALCPAKDAETNTTTVQYFGADALLVCGSARTAFALGAAAISAYLAM